MATDRRFSLLRSHAGTVVGYPGDLVAVVGGLLAFPFTGVLLGLLFILDGRFLVVAIPILLIVYVFLQIALSRACIGIGRRLLGLDQHTELKSMKKTCRANATNGGLWDRWIDGL